MFRRIVRTAVSCLRCLHSPMSSDKTVNLLNLVSASVYAAEEAGKIVRDVMRRGDLAIVDKGINDLQTEADRKAQRTIFYCLQKNFPHVPIIGEEDLPDEQFQSSLSVGFDKAVLTHSCPSEYSVVDNERIVVWVDPLDGTSEYTQGFLDHVTVLIGIAVDGKAVAGVISQPFANYKTDPQTTGRTVWGLVGLGVFGAKEMSPPTDKLVIATSKSHWSENVSQTMDALQPCEILRVGGTGNKVLLVIEGKAHAYVYPSSGCKKWDTCAPEAVLRAKGGILTDVHGNDIPYDRSVVYMNETGVVAAISKETHENCITRIPVEVKHRLIPKHGL